MADPSRRALAEYLQENASEAVCGPDGPQDAILVGWCLVTEWVGSDGHRWLAKNSSDANGDGLTSWQQRGYLSEALDGNWNDDA